MTIHCIWKTLHQIYTEVIDDTKRKAAESIHLNTKNKKEVVSYRFYLLFVNIFVD